MAAEPPAPKVPFDQLIADTTKRAKADPDLAKLLVVLAKVKPVLLRRVLRHLGLLTAVEPTIEEPDTGDDWEYLYYPEFDPPLDLGRLVLMTTNVPGRQYRLTIISESGAHDPIVEDTGVVDAADFWHWVKDCRVADGGRYTIKVRVHPADPEDPEYVVTNVLAVGSCPEHCP